MKTLLTFMVLFMFAINMKTTAQDRIITTAGDTLNCKITKEKNNYVYFIFRYKGEVRNTLLSLDKILSINKGFYTTPDITAEEMPKEPNKQPVCRLAFNGGWGYRLGKAEGGSGTANDYINDSRSGFNLGMDLHFFVNPNWALGLEYSLYKSSVSKTIPGGGNMEDNINIHFVGPSVCYYLSNAKNTGGFFWSAGLGYAGYHDKGKAGNIDGKITGGTFGSTIALGYDIGVSKTTAITLKISLLGASLSKIKADLSGKKETIKLDSDNKENISNLKISVGLRFFP